ncbi:superfamily I DNA/RNA helicase [Actinocorallia herbida]|uniref:DNA 3'-5' helicase n=1 Tax=Actinocorallia herbida TaxID=58109 RepID=A0A3N1CP82_9ACTN|nr:superfamily I DNA/RNA helicase [Actinocorallia herbida]
MVSSPYRLVRRGGPGVGPARTEAPALDAAQRAVVAHSGGPLLVLAGPGTGKTTTIVEAVVDRIERRGTDPERVLVLTFSRRAAEELRQRITGRLGATTRSPLALTFHSYAWALLRRQAVLDDLEPPRLLTGPEQLLEVRRMLEGEVDDGAKGWPERLLPALETRGFAEELRDFVSRAQERGIDPRRLYELGIENGRDDWTAVARFMVRYDQRFALDPVQSYDYAEIIREAAGLLTHDEDVRRRERAAYDAVFVDEYQDADPAQEALLQGLAGGGRDLVAVGDPDQSIYAFRGADVRGILDFPDRFTRHDGSPAPVLPLTVSRRMPERLLEASRRVARRLPGPAEHRALAPGEEAPEGEAETEGAHPGEVRVVVADGASQEAAVVADELRHAHLLEGVPWSRCAVLVRGAHQVAGLRRALVQSGVPVSASAEDVPLYNEPAVRPLLMVLRAALRPGNLTERIAEELLTGPLGGADALGMRRLRRALRDLEELAHGTRGGGETLVAALDDARELIFVNEKVRAPAERVAALIRTARETGGTAEDVLWAVWEQSGLGERWLAESQRGGARGAAADRDLDAVVALFDRAARFVDRLPKGGPLVFVEDLADQEIAGDTLADRAPDGETVKILTAHRAKGLEWDVVAVAGVQEGLWPDLRLRGSLLGVEELIEGPDLLDPVSGATLAAKMMAEERRLFYVAVTRARKRLIVTAVGGEDTEDRPSRFLNELVPGGAQEVRPEEKTRWLSLPALVADLRSSVADPGRPLALRRAAAAHLARLARAQVRGAGPDGWYAITPLSDPGPAFPAGEQIAVSPSQVETFTTCGLRWLLTSAVGAQEGSPGEYSTMGKVIHAVAELAGSVPEVTERHLAQRLDEIWSDLDFRSAWYGEKQRAQAAEMVDKFMAWHRDNPNEIVALEESFKVDLGRVVIRGRIDRAERDVHGRGVIIDIKTGGQPVPSDQLARNPQLGVYQYAVMLGAFARHGLLEPGGAKLVQVGKAAFTRKAREQSQPPPADDPDPAWPKKLVEIVAEGMSSPVFQATVNEKCRTCPVQSCCPVHENGGEVGS